MTDHHETNPAPVSDHEATSTSPDASPATSASGTSERAEKQEKKPSLRERLTTYYREKPITFALSIIGISVILFILGGLLSDGSLSL